jgi:hypothetical protein
MKYWMQLFIIVSNSTRTQIQILAQGNTAVQIVTLKTSEHSIWKWMYGTVDTIRTGRLQLGHLCDILVRIVCGLTRITFTARLIMNSATIFNYVKCYLDLKKTSKLYGGGADKTKDVDVYIKLMFHQNISHSRTDISVCRCRIRSH